MRTIPIYNENLRATGSRRAAGRKQGKGGIGRRDGRGAGGQRSSRVKIAPSTTFTGKVATGT